MDTQIFFIVAGIFLVFILLALTPRKMGSTRHSKLRGDVRPIEEGGALAHYARTAGILTMFCHSPFETHVGQGPVESNHLAGHEVELIDLEHLLHLLLVLLGDDHRLAHLTRSIVRPLDHLCKGGGGGGGHTQEKCWLPCNHQNPRNYKFFMCVW